MTAGVGRDASLDRHSSARLAGMTAGVDRYMSLDRRFFSAV